MRGEIWIITAAISLAAHASFAAWVATRHVAKQAVPHAIEMRIVAPKQPPKIEEPPPPPPLPPPPPPKLVKKLAPKPVPVQPAAPPPPEAQKIGVAPDSSAKDGLAVAPGSTSEGDIGTGNTMEPTPPAPPPPAPEPVAKKPAPAGKHFVPIFQVTRMPKAKRPISPEIPEAFRDAQREALVVVEVELDDHGKVLAAKVIRHAEFGLDDAALAAAKQTDFEPALVGEQPVAVRYQIPYRFRVRG